MANYNQNPLTHYHPRESPLMEQGLDTSERQRYRQSDGDILRPIRPPQSSIRLQLLDTYQERRRPPLNPPVETSRVPGGRANPVNDGLGHSSSVSTLEASSSNHFAASLPSFSNMTLPSPSEIQMEPDRPNPPDFSAHPLSRFVAEPNAPWDPARASNFSDGTHRTIAGSDVHASHWALPDFSEQAHRYDDTPSERGSVTTGSLPCDSAYGSTSMTSRSVFSADAVHASRRSSIIPPPENSYLSLLDSREPFPRQPESVASRRASQTQGLQTKGSIAEHLPFGCDQCESRFKSQSELKYVAQYHVVPG